MAGNCRGAYLIAIFTRFGGLKRTSGTKGTMGTTWVTGIAEPRVLVKGVCVGDEDVGGGLRDVDGELGELGVE